MSKSKKDLSRESVAKGESRVYLILGSTVAFYFLSVLYPSLVLSLIAVWIVLLAVLVLRLDSRFTLAFGIFGLTLLPPVVRLHHENLAEKIASFAFIFLVSGVIQQTFELLKDRSRDENETL